MPHFSEEEARQKAERLSREAKQGAEKAKQSTVRRLRGTTSHAGSWIEKLAKLGYVTKGAVYTLVGVLAIGVAIGVGGRTTSPSGVLGTIYREPFGRVLLVLVAIGLIGYAFWRLFQAVADPDGEGDGAKGIGKRIGHGMAALAYAGLAFSAGRMALVSNSGGGSSEQDWAARLFSEPFGEVLVIVVGAVVVGYGLSQLYQAYNAKFLEYLKLGQMSEKEEAWVTKAGRFGYAARGVVFGLIGVFLIQAAIRFESSQAQGLGGALQKFLQQPYGSWLLAVVALGLIAYGLFMVAIARYRRVA